MAPRQKKRLNESLKAIETSQMRCPKGHSLPYRTANGLCTPIYCADAEGARGSASKKVNNVREAHKKVRAAVEKDAPALVKTLQTNDPLLKDAKEATLEGRIEETVKIGRAAGRFAARSAVVAVPEGLSGVPAEEWADKKLTELLPYAIAEVEFQLKFGDDKQREAAADKVMNATGRGKRENTQPMTPTIVLLGSGEGAALNFPWLKKQPKPAITEGAAVEGPKRSDKA